MDWVTVEYPLVSFALGKAETNLVIDCMRAQGFQIDSSGLFRVQPEPYTLAKRYNTYSATEAESRGYTWPDSGDDRRETPVPATGSERTTFLRALTGFDDGVSDANYPLVDPSSGEQLGTQDAPGGCKKVAVEKLYGSVDGYVKFVADDLFVQNVAGEASRRAEADARFAQMNTQWAECMARAGYRYQAPTDPAAASWPEPRPGDVERTTAAADMTCRSEIGYLGTIGTIERDYQMQALDQFGPVLQQIETSRAKLVASLP
ncbi:MAG: hypothetical protein QM733_21280 [Ilumatobacteraceae bacterium]